MDKDTIRKKYVSCKNFFKHNVVQTLVFILLISLIILSCGGFIYEIIRCTSDSCDAYVYVPAEDRAAFHYTDIEMFNCAWCHRTKKLNRHHIIPQSADPSMKDVYTNIVVLCRDCHFVIGHRCNWKHFNPDVLEIINKYTNDIVSASYLQEYK